MKMIEIPEFKFSIGDTIRCNGDKYSIYNIIYDMRERCWMYKYSYWDGGYEHFCKAKIEYIEKEFEIVK